MRKIVLALLTLLTCTFVYAYENIGAADLAYYGQIFPTATMFSRTTIADSITEGAPNSEVLQLYDRDSKLVGFVREISTDTGCDNVCKILEFTLCYLPDGTFTALISREPLTKIGHAQFTSADNQKLKQILTKKPMSFNRPNEPMDLVDAVTKATLPNFKPDVVSGAALTCFRTNQYNEQTKLFLKKMPSEAIDFTLPDLANNEVLFSYKDDASPFKNKVTVLMFFGSWCSSCNNELPHTQELYLKYKNNPDVKIIAVRTSRSRETEDINKFVARMGLTFPIVSDTDKNNPPANQVAKAYGIAWLPTTFVFKKNGEVVAVPNFLYWQYVDKMSQLIDSLL